MTPNPIRGEVEAKIGPLAITMAVDMDGLARLSAATGYPTLGELHKRLSGTEAMTTWLALELFTVSGKLNGKILKKDEAVSEARARIAIDDMLDLAGPFSLLLASLLRKSEGAQPPGNGDSARNP